MFNLYGNGDKQIKDSKYKKMRSNMYSGIQYSVLQCSSPNKTLTSLLEIKLLNILNKSENSKLPIIQ